MNKAGKDQILVSEAIQQAVGSCFQTEPLGTVALKGKSHEVSVFLLEAARAQPPARTS